MDSDSSSDDEEANFFLERTMNTRNNMLNQNYNQSFQSDQVMNQPNDELFQKKTKIHRILIDSDAITHVSHGNIPVSDMIVGRKYMIVSIGDTNFQTLGGSNQVGIEFVAVSKGEGTGVVTSFDDEFNNNEHYGLQTTKKTHNFIVNFNKNNGFSIFRNVIGISLIRANIAYNMNIISNHNDKLYVEFNGIEYSVTFNHKSYDSEDDLIADIIAQIHLIITLPTLSGIYNETTSKYLFEHQESYSITLNFRESYLLNKSLIYELLGFRNTDIIIIEPSVPLNSTLLSNISLPYIDVVIPEIPYIACKQNTNGNNIIERINVNQERGSMIVFEKLNLYEHNFFYPMVLDKLIIQLFQKHNIPYEHDINNNYEFEITTL